MIKRNSESHLEAFRTLLFAAVATFIIQLIYIFIDGITLGSEMVLINSVHVVIALAMGVWLFFRRDNIPSVKTLEISFLIISAPFILSTWVGESLGLQLGQVRQPLVPFQFFCIYIALLSPGRVWIAVAEIFISLAIAVGFWIHLKSMYTLTGITGEPWVTLTYGLIALMMLGARAYRRLLIQRLEKSRAEAEAFERAARLFLAVRDRANSPLQVINLCVSLIQSRNPEETETVERLRRSLLKLQDLTDILAETDVWRETYEAGGDISKEIDKTFNKLV